MKRIFTFLIASLISLTLTTTSAQAKISQKVLDNILLIGSINETGDTVVLATGFVISNEGHVLTSAHVVGEAKFVQFCAQKLKKNDTYCFKEGTLELLAKDNNFDLALLQLPKDLRSTNSQNYLVLADSSLTGIGDEINIIGYPGTGLYTLNLSRGVISGFVEDYIKTDARLFPGNSGGPALNENNQVVGIATALTSDDYQGLGVLISSNMIKSWLKSVGFISQASQKSKVKLDVSIKTCFDKVTFVKNFAYCTYKMKRD